MKRVTLTVAIAIAATLGPSAGARADFGFKELDATFSPLPGSLPHQAGSHRFSQTTTIEFNTEPRPGYSDEMPTGDVKDLSVSFPAGLVADTTAVPRCSTLAFLEEDCAASSRVGTSTVSTAPPGTGGDQVVPVYNVSPPSGRLIRLAFVVMEVPVVVDIRLSPDPPYEGLAILRNTPQAIPVWRSVVSVQGVTDGAKKPFLTLPARCDRPLVTRFEASSWQEPDVFVSGFSESHDNAEPPNPLGMTGCARLAFEPSVAAKPTSRSTHSPTGLDFSLEVDDEGLLNPSGLAQSQIRKAVVTLPEGMTVNPSLAETLAVCSEAQLQAETPFSAPGEGCPEASKVGTLEVESPLVEEPLDGSLYIAKPYDNLADDSLIALYFVITNPNLGIVIRQPAKVTPDPRTGQLITTVEEIPQLPFSHFRLHFREGARSPLITPRNCGTHAVEAVLTPWAGGPDLVTRSTFEVISGPSEGPCPPGGAPGFEPGFSGGTLNNAAGQFSPFLLRLTRRDGDQDVVRFDASLPPGGLAKLAGVEMCSDAAIARIKARTGLQERAKPSCPASSRIGSVLAGAGVGSQLTYVPGSVYLAGPFGGAPLSVVGVVPAVAGPFDVGVVSTRQALTLDPVSGQVSVDGTVSEPIPHILAGIPLAVRDIRVAVDRPSFTLNPTNCNALSFGASIWGGGANPFSLADDAPVSRAARFQAADCAALGFKPRLTLRLRGGTRRGGHPALRAVLRPRPGDANLRRAVVKLPGSAFLDQGHIRTICTRVQFAADACPKGSIYGRVRAFTPLLAEPLEGPAILRSSNNLLPDLVFDLEGIVNIEASARIDSVRGGIRATFDGIPDAPVSRVVVHMFGAKRGLIVNSRNLCRRGKRGNRGNVTLNAHNGRRRAFRPQVRAVNCKRKRGKAKRSSHRRRAARTATAHRRR